MLIAERLRKGFGQTVAVRDVSFSIEPGRTLGMIGPNGAGKTTTMRMILGILVPDGGSMTWNGEKVDDRMRHRFGYLPEERGLYGRMEVREHVEYFARLHGCSARDARRRAGEWIARLELETYASRSCGELSKGNQQKVQIACAAVHSPELLVLDEPFSGLDPVNAEIVAGILRGLHANGTALVLSSHQLWQLEQLCDRYCIIFGGESRRAGTLDDLRRTIPLRVVRVAPNSVAVREVLAGVDGARSVDGATETACYEVPAATDVSRLLSRLVAVDAIHRFEALESSLRDVYLDVVGEPPSSQGAGGEG
ncbi:MAG: ATP-binding cassette domain-containing protein [Candidatus Eremiobacteraeota bacterium]|nr:ATP-binding cassette domain-containing protein [Candidatus Eremiobacteraeota bacterium]